MVTTHHDRLGRVAEVDGLLPGESFGYVYTRRGEVTQLSAMEPVPDAPTNLRLGQDYFRWLLDTGDYDMLRAIAAYNGGPGTLQKTVARLGPDADPLTLIESLPSRETRNYVEQVMVAYWNYSRKFGGETRSLDALANGARVIDYRLDQ